MGSRVEKGDPAIWQKDVDHIVPNPEPTGDEPTGTNDVHATYVNTLYQPNQTKPITNAQFVSSHQAHAAPQINGLDVTSHDSISQWH